MGEQSREVIGCLRQHLPGFTQEAAARGCWRIGRSRAWWRLEPEGAAFWLVVGGPLGEGVMARMGPGNAWPWPLKTARSQPGAAWCWQAELLLHGGGDDPPRLERLTALLAQGRGHASAGPRSAEHHPPPDWPQLLAEVFGSAGESASSGTYRWPMPSGPALEFRAAAEAIWGRCVLVRASEALPPAAQAALEDLLAVANGRLYGCRAFLDGAPEGPLGEAFLETCLAWTEFSARTVRARGARLRQAAASLARACQALAEIEPLAAAYRDHLLFPFPNSEVLT